MLVAFILKGRPPNQLCIWNLAQNRCFGRLRATLKNRLAGSGGDSRTGVIRPLLWQLWSSSDGFVPDNREVGFAGKVLSHRDLREIAHNLCTLHSEWWRKGHRKFRWLYKSEYRGVDVQDDMPHSSGNKNGFSWMLNTLHRGVPGVQIFVKSRITRGRTYIVLSSHKPSLLMHE